MKFSELIRAYIDLKIEGEPQSSEWVSIEHNRRQQDCYREELEALETEIDAAIAAGGSQNG